MKEILESLMELNGACVVNLQEPSEGDLERVYTNYLVERKQRILLQKKFDKAFETLKFYTCVTAAPVREPAEKCLKELEDIK